MVDLGNGVAIDNKDNPSVFLIQGLGEIRMQKGMTRTNGVNPEQFKVMADFFKPKKVKNEQRPNNANVGKTSPGKTGTTCSRGAATAKGHGPIA